MNYWKKINFVSIHVRNLHILKTEMYRVSNKKHPS